jgi:phosphohistidine phosphatase
VKLFILRHAKTQRNSTTGKDFDRDLKPHGRNQLELMREFFNSNYDGLNFSVYCSSATRTRSTLSELRSSINVSQTSFNDELYLPNLNELLHFIWNQTDNSKNILLVGHNNGLSDLCSYVSDDDILLPTCGLVVYDFPETSNISEISKATGVEINRYFPDA